MVRSPLNQRQLQHALQHVVLHVTVTVTVTMTVPIVEGPGVAQVLRGAALPNGDFVPTTVRGAHLVRVAAELPSHATRRRVCARCSSQHEAVLLEPRRTWGKRCTVPRVLVLVIKVVFAIEVVVVARATNVVRSLLPFGRYRRLVGRRRDVGGAQHAPA